MKLTAVISAVVLTGAIPTLSTAATLVEDTHVLLFPAFPMGDYQLLVFQDAPGKDGTSILFDVDMGATPGTATLTFVDTNIDEASDWYGAEADQLFWAGSIAVGTHEMWGGPVPAWPTSR